MIRRNNHILAGLRAGRLFDFAVGYTQIKIAMIEQEN